MSRPVTITLLGEPLASARPRFVRRTGIAYTPQPQRIFAAALRHEAHVAMTFMQAALFDEPVQIDLLVECSIPSSWSQKKQAAAIRREVRPTKRPDLSNVLKLVEDALNGVVYRDDSAIVALRCRKFFSSQPKLIVTVQPIAARTAERAA